MAALFTALALCVDRLAQIADEAELRRELDAPDAVVRLVGGAR